jgi:two-component system nitrogen regulation response regulator GlnG
MTEAALKLLAAFEFPGNVRQLENICHWLTVMAPGQRVDAADLPPDVRSASGASAHDSEGNWQQALDRELARALARGERSVADRLEKEFERTLIVRALATPADTGWKRRNGWVGDETR